MSITIDQVVYSDKENTQVRSLSKVIPESANLCNIYSFNDFPRKIQNDLISEYTKERNQTINNLLSDTGICGETTMQDLEDLQEEFDEIRELAAYELDSLIENEWVEEFGIQSELDEIALDNKCRNGNLITSH